MTGPQPFWPRVDKRGPNECWEWTAYRTPKGYGYTRHNKRGARAHRVAWELTHGPIPEGLCVLHRCDNPPCVNPDHLWVGTRGDNNRDRAVKGRTVNPDNRGEKHPQAKLTNAQVRDIRRQWADGKTQRALGREYGVASDYVWRIVHHHARRYP